MKFPNLLKIPKNKTEKDEIELRKIEIMAFENRIDQKSLIACRDVHKQLSEIHKKSIKEIDKLLDNVNRKGQSIIYAQKKLLKEIEERGKK